MTFLDGHSSSGICTPSRFALLTGQHHWRRFHGIVGAFGKSVFEPGDFTIAKMLKQHGYKTGCFGKWHLGWDWHKDGEKIDFTKPVKNGPDINGFDSYYGHCGSLDMPPYVWVDTGKCTAVPDRAEGVTSKQDPYGWYRKGPISPDFKIDEVLPHLFDKSVAYINERAADAESGKPFFLYLPLPAPHTPIVPVPPFKDASGINPYADFVMQCDHQSR